jgi:membrane-associated protease RseP (regulator of RpoE activity)
MRRLFPWIACLFLALWCVGLLVEVRKLRGAANAATAGTTAADGTSAGEASEVSPAPNIEKDEIATHDRSELMKLRNEVHQLRESGRELEARVKAQEQQLSAAKAAREGAWPIIEAVRPELIQIKPGMIGAMFIAKNERPMVRAVAENSPAGRAGIKPGDFILSVDGTNVSEMTFTQVMQAVRGDVGTDVILEIDDGTQNGRRQVRLTRESVKLQDIKVPSPYE